jgi:hypothetical protein
MISPFEPSPTAPAGRPAVGMHPAPASPAPHAPPATVAELRALLATRAGGARERGRALPAALTLVAPGALPYATLVEALAAARSNGVRQARVVVTM